MKHKKTMLSLFIALLIASSSSLSSANGLSVEELADQKFAEMRSVIQADLRSGGTGGLGGWWGPELTAELERRGYQEKWNEIYEEERAKFEAEQISNSSSVDVNKMLEELPEKAKLLAIAELKNDVNGLGEWYDEATLQALNEVGYFEKRQQLIEEYKTQLLAEQAAQVPQPTESPQQQLVSEQEVVQNVAAQPQTPVQSTPSKTSEPTKVLPKTSDATSILSYFGVVIGLLGLAGFKKRSNQCLN